MSREIKLGAFALIVLAGFIWGFTFLKGKNILAKSYSFNTIVSDVTQVTKSSPVYINGLRVGTVFNIKMNPDNLEEMIVSFEVENDYKIPTNAKVYLAADGFVGGRALRLKFDQLCNGSNCAESGHTFEGASLGFISSFVDSEEAKEYAEVLSTELTKVVENLGTEEGKGALNQTLLDLQKTMNNLASITASTDKIVRNSSRSLTQTIENMSLITGNLAQNNEQITSMLNNLNDVTTQISKADVGSTITGTTETLEEAKKVMTKLQTTLDGADQAMTQLNEAMTKANNGDGTLAKLLNDKELYENMEMTTKNLSLLLQDFRLNPNRYVKVSVFGRKNNEEYVKPENDPAFQQK